MIERLALCNEVLAPWGFAEQCAYAAKLGYRALEVAPFTLADDPMSITDAQPRTGPRSPRPWPGDQRAALAAGGAKGLSISHPMRRCASAADVVARLVELCAQLGGSYLVHGSPAQRHPAARPERGRCVGARHRGLGQGRRARAALGLHYCIEPLSREQTSVLNTVDEALAIVTAAACPA